MARAKRFDCEVWDMRRFRRCDVVSYHTLRRVVSKLIEVSEGLKEAMLKVIDTRNHSVKRLRYEPALGRVIVEHMVHPDAGDISEIYLFHEQLWELEKYALSKLGNNRNGVWQQFEDRKTRRATRNEVWTHFQDTCRKLYEEWDRLLKDRDRQALRLIERMAASIRRLRPDLSVVALGPDEDSERSEAVLHSVLTADGPDALAEALMPRLLTSPYWHP